MCGIYGKFHFAGGVDVRDSMSALSLMEHRGPDGFGFQYGDFSEKPHHIYHNSAPEGDISVKTNFFLGHRRLSIIDLNDNANQPMLSSDNDYSIIFNGEIYNYIELKNELLDLGSVFTTDHSDTEVLLNSYAMWGNECVNKLRGMFAFAIFDKKKDVLFIARDRVGQKGLYYEFVNDQFTFSSELPPISNFNGPRKIDNTALNMYMALGYIPHPYTLYSDICKLPPATFAILDLKTRGFTQHEYWDIDVEEDATKPVNEIVEDVKSLLAESVKYRLRADVSVGAFISGGTDSTLIVKNIAESGKGKFDIYGADFPNTNRSEKKYIVEAANRYNQNLKLSNIDLSHVKNINSIIKVFDEPFDGASSIALYDLFDQASKDHKVILTGDGGDEMFAGYTRYLSYSKKEKLINRLDKLIFPRLILNLLLSCGVKHEKLLTLKRLLNGDTLSNFVGINSGSVFLELLKPKFRNNDLEKSKTFSTLNSKLKEKALSPVKALQYIEFKTILPGRMLYKLDRFSMAYGVEARSPFLDHKLIEMAFTIPDKVNITKAGVTKAVLKSMLSQDFDETFVHREKQGFGNPLSYWFKSADPSDIFSVLLNKDSFIYSYLDFSTTHEKFPQFKNGYRGLGEKSMWRLMVLAHYLEENKNHIQYEA